MNDKNKSQGTIMCDCWGCVSGAGCDEPQEPRPPVTGVVPTKDGAQFIRGNFIDTPPMWNGAPQDGTIFFGPKIEMPKGFGSQFNDLWMMMLKRAAEEAFGATKDQVTGFDFGDDGRVTAMAATIVNVSESLKQRVEEFTKKVDGAVKEATEKFFKRDLVVVRLDFVGYGVGKRFQQRSCSMRHKKRRRSRALERVYKERRFREFKNIWPKSIEPSGSLNLPEMLKQYNAGSVMLNFSFQPGSSPQPK